MTNREIQLNEEECIELWKKKVNRESPITEGNRPEDYLMNEKTIKRTLHLINTLRKVPEFHSIHELGCNVGRNLVEIKKVFPHAKVSGNDVNLHAFNVGRKFYGKDMRGIKLILEPTQDFIKRKVHYDVLLSMAHIMHLPHSCDNLLRERLPKICDTLILYEPKDRHDLGDYIFARDFYRFFTIKPYKKIWRPVREINRAYVFDFRKW
jgi:hypothetical protein